MIRIDGSPDATNGASAVVGNAGIMRQGKLADAELANLGIPTGAAKDDAMGSVALDGAGRGSGDRALEKRIDRVGLACGRLAASWGACGDASISCVIPWDADNETCDNV